MTQTIYLTLILNADGEQVSKEEVYKAIWTLHQYYYDMQEAINDLDSYID